MALSDVAIPSAKPPAKQQKLYDGGGLRLITLTGSRRWIFKYRFAGKEKSLALGVDPNVPLADARKRRDDAGEKLAADIDPGKAKKADKRAARLAAANSFEAVALAWMEQRRQSVEINQYEKTPARFKNDGFPWLGKRPITEIDAPEILAVLKRIDSRGGALPLAVCAAKSAGRSATRSRKVVARPIQRAIWLTQYRPRRQRISPRIRNPSRSARCCGPSMRFPARSRFYALSGSRQCYLCAPTN